MSFSGDIIWVGPNAVNYNYSIRLRIGYQAKTTSLTEMLNGWVAGIKVSSNHFPPVEYTTGLIFGAGVGEYVDIVIGFMPAYRVCFEIELFASQGKFLGVFGGGRELLSLKRHCIDPVGIPADLPPDLLKPPVEEEEEEKEWTDIFTNLPVMGIAAAGLIVVGIVLMRR